MKREVNQKELLIGTLSAGCLPRFLSEAQRRGRRNRAAPTLKEKSKRQKSRTSCRCPCFFLPGERKASPKSHEGELRSNGSSVS